MTEMSITAEICPKPAISGYIDGELSPAEELELEGHFIDCRVCTDELNVQKTILIAIGSAMENEPLFELPEDFTRHIVAVAESNVTGLRRRSERILAVTITFGLLLVVVVAMWQDLGRMIFLGSAAADRTGAVVGAAAHLLYDIALGIAIVGKTLFAVFLFDSPTSIATLAAVSAILIFLLSRVFTRRSQERETHLT